MNLESAQDERDFQQLLMLLRKYKEPGPLQRVTSDLIVPDGTNREHTGLSPEHGKLIHPTLHAVEEDML